MQCVKATFITFLLKPKQLFGLPQVFKLSPPRALFKLNPCYNKKEEILIELPLLSGWQMGLEPTTFRTTI